MTVQDDLTCEELNDMAPAYALAALDEMESVACTRHLALAGPHRGCQQVVAEAQRVTTRLSAAVPAQVPAPYLWRAIEARIAHDVPAGTGAVDRRHHARELDSPDATSPGDILVTAETL